MIIPWHNYKHAHAVVTEAWSILTRKYPDDRFYLLGDSAGGGLCLSFAQTLQNSAHRKPEKTVLLSPWLDLSLGNPEIQELEQKDLLLSADTLKKCAGWFAAGTDLKSPVLSPLYGNLNNLASLALFVGTHEIFLPDCRLLKKKMEGSNTTLFYREYEGMQHDWILFPIKERDLLLNDILHYLQRP